MLLIYTTENKNRFSYIAEVLFTCVLPVEFKITHSASDFASYSGTKINYSGSRFANDEIWIQPHALLTENSISKQQIDCFEWHGLKVCFKTVGDIPFDIFAASFYLISRYEEYLPHEKDEYGRYAHKNSVAYKKSFLHLPLINMWMKELQDFFKGKFLLLTFNSSLLTFIPTYDIDIAYAYKGKGVFRNIGGFYKELFTGKWKQLAERANVYSGWKDDPFDTYNWLDDLHEKYALKPIYFFLLADKNKQYDKNISPETKLMRDLVQEHAAKYQIGIHPSWQSGDDENMLDKEINTLKNITGKPVQLSRQHYIRMDIPGTYRLLVSKGIIEEYSMGYGSINGFRASVASPFYWYDLENDIKTSVLIRPYCYMEANSFFEQHYSTQEAAAELQQYHDVVKAVGGQLITIFHNHFVTEQPQWTAWRRMYAAFLEKNFG